jgi:transposase
MAVVSRRAAPQRSTSGLGTGTNEREPPDHQTDRADVRHGRWLRTLARRWHQLQAELTQLDTQLQTLVGAVAPTLVALPGVGVDTAGQLLVTAGDNPHRLRSEAAFAQLCGTAPIPASSGRADRHRLNRGGDRRANHALWRITLVRMRRHPPTRAYVERRTNQGLSKLDIMRCLSATSPARSTTTSQARHPPAATTCPK